MHSYLAPSFNKYSKKNSINNFGYKKKIIFFIEYI